MESKNDQLQAIFDSYINGQLSQMSDQIRDYNNMYDVFDDLRNYLQEIGYELSQANNYLADIVIKYHRIIFR